MSELVEKMMEARGGRDALMSKKAMVLDVIFRDKSGVAAADFKAKLRRDGKMYAEVRVEGHVVAKQGIDEKGEWRWELGTDVISVPEEDRDADMAVGLIDTFYGLYDADKHGIKLTWEPRETVNGVPYYVVLRTYADKSKTLLYINPTTWLIDYDADTDEIDAVVTDKARYAMKSSKYRKFGNLVFAGREERINWDTGEVVETMDLNNVRYESFLTDEELRRPR